MGFQILFFTNQIYKNLLINTDTIVEVYFQHVWCRHHGDKVDHMLKVAIHSDRINTLDKML